MKTSPFARVSVIDQVESTNTMLREAAGAAPGDWPHLSALVAEHQTAGRGRSGRNWSTPRGSALTASILVRPAVPPDRLAWLTLLTGLAVVRALDSPRIGLKWPNDILVTDAGPHRPGWGTARKLGGILTEALPAGAPAMLPATGPGAQPATAHADQPGTQATPAQAAQPATGFADQPGTQATPAQAAQPTDRPPTRRRARYPAHRRRRPGSQPHPGASRPPGAHGHLPGGYRPAGALAR